MVICQWQLKIFNHYRKHWVGAYLQQHGVKIIPTIRASTDERSLQWFLDGTPTNSVVAISSMYTNDSDSFDYFMREYNTMYENLKPQKIFVYGKIYNELRGNLERIKTNCEVRFIK